MGIVIRLIKFGFLAVAVLFVVLTVLSLLLPSDLRVTRVIDVAASRRRLDSAVGDFRTWREWNEFVTQTSLTNVRYSAPAAGAGAYLRADQLTITERRMDSAGVLLTWDLTGGKRFNGGFQFLSLNPDSLTVQWWFDFHFRWYPWERLGVFVYDRKLGPEMEESLKGLKRFVENSR